MSAGKRTLRALLPALWALLFLAIALASAAYLIDGVYSTPLQPQHLRLERPWALLLLPAALLVLVARGWLQRRAAPRLQISRGADLARVGSGLRFWFKDSVTGMRATAIALLAGALAGPQSIHARDTVDTEGIDIVVTMDMSLSMQAADIQPNRFEATKFVVQDFIARRPNDRVGAVVFGRDAFTLLPLTTDKEALRNVISELQLQLIDGRGTAIGNAVGVSLNRLRRSKAKSKVVILLTDGDSNAGNVSPDQAAELAKALGVKVFTILMGQHGDARVQRGADMFGRPLWDRGSYPVNPELLQQISDRSGGESYRVADRKSLEQSFHSILDRLEKSEIEDAGRVYGELFGALVWPALALLALEMLLGSFWLRRWP